MEQKISGRVMSAFITYDENDNPFTGFILSTGSQEIGFNFDGNLPVSILDEVNVVYKDREFIDNTVYRFDAIKVSKINCSVGDGL